jgi:hypothetical protein
LAKLGALLRIEEITTVVLDVVGRGKAGTKFVSL